MKYKEKMTWTEFKFLIKKLRQEGNRLTEEVGTQIWCEFQFPIYSRNNNVIMINPYALNLKTGEYWGRELASGIHVAVNFRKELEKKVIEK